MLKPLFGLGLLAILLGCAPLPAPAVAATQASQPTLLPVSYFRTQEHDAVFHPEPAMPDNANCGPTSLAMAVLAYGVAPVQDRDAAHAQELIDAARLALTGSDDASQWTYPAQFPAAAAHFGLQARMVSGLDGVVAAAQRGHLVVVNINPTPAYANQLVYPCDGGHFALVTGVMGDQVALNDPLAAGPITITREQLATALTTELGAGIAPYDGGIELWRNVGILASR